MEINKSSARYAAREGFRLMMTRGIYSGHVSDWRFDFDADAWAMKVTAPNGKTYAFKPAKSWL